MIYTTAAVLIGGTLLAQAAALSVWVTVLSLALKVASLVAVVATLVAIVAVAWIRRHS